VVQLTNPVNFEGTTVTPGPYQTIRSGAVATFVLVHGAWHGAWCWERLVPELERRGHRTVAVDLPCADPHATFEDYTDVVCDAVPDGADDAVLVGHSLGGHAVARAAARRPFAHLVYLCALVPEPGRSMVDQARDRDGMLDPAYLAGLGPADAEGRRVWVDEQIAREILYDDCTAEVAHAAFARLRPQSNAPYAVPCPLAELPQVSCSYVLATADKLIGADWSRRAAGRLGAEIVAIRGGHSPSLARPAELADVLAYAIG
jgi:pimeloyl-ACP methyl ester carboxylesterase